MTRHVDTDDPGELSGEPDVVFLSAEHAIALLFGRVEEEQYDLNRRSAARAAALADALAYARHRASIYALAGDPCAQATAERCAISELSARLRLSEASIRSLATTAEEARVRLPLLWRQAREGIASMAHVEAAVALLVRLDAYASTDASNASGAVDAFDAALAEVAAASSVSAFRARARAFARSLAPQPESALHARALAERRVSVAHVGDGMSYVTMFVATLDAVAIMRRLTATAKHQQKSERGDRSRDQVRADLLVSWARGTGTATAVKTKVFVTVPLDRLDPVAQTSVRTGVAPRRGVDLSREPQLLGEGPLDDSSAIRLLLEAGRFTRIVTDPVTGVVLDMDRRARTVTRAQHEWLVLTHGTCTRDGCRRSAVGAEIDHWREFNGTEHGATDIENLHPFCAPDHARKGTTRMRFRRRSDGSVQMLSPTDFATAAEPWPDLDFSRPEPRLTPVLDALRARRRVPDAPPF